ncbi:Mu-like prophage FluMu I protein [Photobacterium marinum]|uniref:Mu-like prophage FluMu I protein n=1 Tax=Photobacterium marinum TaxID=1056511 RepID=L8JAF7_9GAMM|nr:phage protease [Photobacterium marinum]ELR65850.1 Mu-like prophage FluMu I protein [Photobacterium marinum]
MKTSNLTQIAQAVLTANLASNLAVLVADLNQPDDGWVQLLPAGKFKARDGRPFDTEDGHWHLDASIAAQMIAATKAAAPKVLIDYEHQTLHAAENGKPAPAAGWLTSDSDIEWREGQGLYIKPGWTKAAQTHIDNDEYAFLSAVFPYDKQGRPLMLRMAAITNDPGVVGMESLAALYAEKTADFSLRFNNHNGQAGSEISLYGQMEDTKVDEILKQLLARLGIEVSDALTPEQGQAALTALDALKTKAGESDDLKTQVATLTAQVEQGTNLSKFVPVEAYNGVLGELAALKAGTDATSIDSVIDAAKRKGQIVEAETGYLKQFGQQQGVAALSAMLDKRPAIAALTAQQTTTNPPPAGDPGKESLTEEELAVLRACDLDKDAFLKAKQENAE